MTICKVEGCPNVKRAKGYCPRHLWRFNRYGKPGIPGTITERWSEEEDAKILKIVNRYPPGRYVPDGTWQDLAEHMCRTHCAVVNRVAHLRSTARAG